MDNPWLQAGDEIQCSLSTASELEFKVFRAGEMIRHLKPDSEAATSFVRHSGAYRIDCVFTPAIRVAFDGLEYPPPAGFARW